MFGKIYTVIKSFLLKIKEDRCDAYAAQAAYFIILSSIPFLMFLFSFASYTIISKEILVEAMEGMLPEYIMSFVQTIINDVYDQSIGLISVSALATIWSAAKAVQYIKNGINAVHGILETRNFILLRIQAVFYMLLFVLAIIFSLVLLVFGNKIQMLLEQFFPLMAGVMTRILSFRLLISLGVFTLFFTLIFTALPNQKVTFKSQLPGGFLCAAAWSVFSKLLAVYVDYFHGFSTYGSLSAIALVMFWLYFCTYIMLICAEINVFFCDYFHYKMFIWKNKKEREEGKSREQP